MEKNIYPVFEIRQVTPNDTNDPNAPNKPFLRVTVGILPRMVRVGIKVPLGGCTITNAQIEAKTAAGQMLLVRLEGLYFEKAWNGFGGNNDGFTFGAERVVEVNPGAPSGGGKS